MDVSNWMADDESEWCCCCGDVFSITKRRHHCRKCGRLVCATCSAYRHKQMRLCVNCNAVNAQRRRGMMAEYPRISSDSDLLNSELVSFIHDTFLDLLASPLKQRSFVNEGMICVGRSPATVPSSHAPATGTNSSTNDQQQHHPCYRLWFTSPNGWWGRTSVLENIPHDIQRGYILLEAVYHVSEIRTVDVVAENGADVVCNDGTHVTFYPCTPLMLAAADDANSQSKQSTYYDGEAMRVLQRTVSDVKGLLSSHCARYEVLRFNERQKLDALLEERSKQVDWDIDEHVELLKRVWASFFPSGDHGAFPGTKSPLWREIGFQGDDPSTDFRGMGALGLRTIVYWGEKYSGDVRRALKKQPDDIQYQYPLCVAIINCVNLSVEVLLRDTRVFNIMIRGYHPLQVHELTRCLITAIDRLWWHHHAKYFDFGRIMKLVRQRLDACIEHNPASFETLCAWMLDARWT